jgi:hypothetical protein
MSVKIKIHQFSDPMWMLGRKASAIQSTKECLKVLEERDREAALGPGSRHWLIVNCV